MAVVRLSAIATRPGQPGGPRGIMPRVMRAFLLCCAVAGLLTACGGSTEKQWYKPNVEYTVAEFQRDRTAWRKGQIERMPSLAARLGLADPRPDKRPQPLRLEHALTCRRAFVFDAGSWGHARVSHGRSTARTGCRARRVRDASIAGAWNGERGVGDVRVGGGAHRSSTRAGRQLTRGTRMAPGATAIAQRRAGRACATYKLSVLQCHMTCVAPRARRLTPLRLTSWSRPRSAWPANPAIFRSPRRWDCRREASRGRLGRTSRRPRVGDARSIHRVDKGDDLSKQLVALGVATDDG